VNSLSTAPLIVIGAFARAVQPRPPSYARPALAAAAPAGWAQVGGCPDCNKQASRRLAGALLPRFVASAAAKAVSAERPAPHGPDLLGGTQRWRRRLGLDPGTDSGTTRRAR